MLGFLASRPRSPVRRDAVEFQQCGQSGKIWLGQAVFIAVKRFVVDSGLPHHFHLRKPSSLPRYTQGKAKVFHVPFPLLSPVLYPVFRQKKYEIL